MKKIMSLSVIVIGFTAMASQIVFIRELLVVFYGNELSIGFILASWLAGGAIGSGLLGRFADRVKFRLNLFLSCQIILSILLPLNILAIRLIKAALHINPGEIIPLSPMAITSFPRWTRLSPTPEPEAAPEPWCSSETGPAAPDAA